MKASGREVELSKNRLTNLEAFMSHANAALTPKARLRLARPIVEEHWAVARAAERYDVSWPTAKRWADRYRDAGEAGMGDRSFTPCWSVACRTGCPTLTGSPVNRSGVMSTRIRGRCCTSTSRNSATPPLRRAPLRRPSARQQEPGRDSGQAPQRHLRAADGQSVRAHRHR